MNIQGWNDLTVAGKENYKMFKKNIMRDIFGKLKEKKRKENTKMIISCTYKEYKEQCDCSCLSKYFLLGNILKYYFLFFKNYF